MNPFPGFREFGEEEAHLFFGREKQIDELLKKLRTSRFLSVLGDSGRGKSSLVKAGIIPSLHSGFMVEAGSSWNVLLTRPGNNPIGNLTTALIQNGLFSESETKQFNPHQIAIDTLRRSENGLIEIVRQAGLEENENLLIIVDQFEELFSFNKQEQHQLSPRNDAAAFVQLLLKAARQSKVPLYIIITLRSDFLGNCSKFHGLPQAINQAQYLIPNMTREESRRAITGPLAVSNINITPRLQERLLNDLDKTQDQLPLLQFTLKQITDYWYANSNEKTPLDIKHYESCGMLSDAVNRYAEKIYKEINDMKRLRIADTVFTMVTDQTNDMKDMRRPTTVRELADISEATTDEVIEVINKFREPGYELLRPLASEELTRDSLIDLSHESLMRLWKRFRLLIEEEQQSVKLYRRLAHSAKMYQEGKAELWRDPDLMLAKTWYLGNKPNAAWGRRYDHYFERAITFLKASEDQKDLEVNREHKNWNKKMVHYRRMALLGFILAIVFFILTALLFFKMNANVSWDDISNNQKEQQELVDEAVYERTIWRYG